MTSPTLAIMHTAWLPLTLPATLPILLPRGSVDLTPEQEEIVALRRSASVTSARYAMTVVWGQWMEGDMEDGSAKPSRDDITTILSKWIIARAALKAIAEGEGDYALASRAVAREALEDSTARGKRPPMTKAKAQGRDPHLLVLHVRMSFENPAWGPRVEEHDSTRTQPPGERELHSATSPTVVVKPATGLAQGTIFILLAVFGAGVAFGVWMQKPSTPKDARWEPEIRQAVRRIEGYDYYAINQLVKDELAVRLRRGDEVMVLGAVNIAAEDYEEEVARLEAMAEDRAAYLNARLELNP